MILSRHGTDQVCSRVTINKLPDEVLLDIFGFCMAYPLPPPPYEDDAWHTLVHVCRWWRYVVFGSSRRLNLRLLCTNGRLGKTLDIWPELPIVVHVDDWETLPMPLVTSVISVLKRSDRVCKIIIGNVQNRLLLVTMNEPFPALIELELASFKVGLPILPDSFLGGYVPRLRSLKLRGISIPGIRRLLLSTRDLVTLSLGFTQKSGYTLPERIVDILSALARLKSLHLRFEIPPFRIHGAGRRPPGTVLTRVVLPVLTTFEFAGNSKFLGDIVSRINAPLESIAVAMTHTDEDQLEFDISLLGDFIWHTKLLNAPYRADIFFTDYDSGISLFQRKGGVDFKVLDLAIPCFASDLQLSGLVQVCNSLLLPLPGLEHLSIHKSKSEFWSLRWQVEVENTQWLEFLRSFIAVKDLVLDERVILFLASTLQGLVGEQVTEILPLLQNIVLEGFPSSRPVPKGIATFIAAREVCGCPVVVDHQERK